MYENKLKPHFAGRRGAEVRRSGRVTLSTDARRADRRRRPDATARARCRQRFALSAADRDLDVVPLYVDTEPAVLDADKDSIGGSRAAKNLNRAALRQSISTGTDLHPDAILDRHRLRVGDGERISSGTYFNGVRGQLLAALDGRRGGHPRHHVSRPRRDRHRLPLDGQRPFAARRLGDAPASERQPLRRSTCR